MKKFMLCFLGYMACGFLTFAHNWDRWIDPKSQRFQADAQVGAILSGGFWPVYWIGYGGGTAAFWVVRHGWGPGTCEAPVSGGILPTQMNTQIQICGWQVSTDGSPVMWTCRDGLGGINAR